MRYSTEEAMCEILHRSEKITNRRNHWQQMALSCTAGVLGIVLIALIAMLPGETAMNLNASTYGALMAGKEKGGYVLIALVAFVLGVTVTLACLRYRKKKSNESDVEDTSENR